VGETLRRNFAETDILTSPSGESDNDDDIAHVHIRDCEEKTEHAMGIDGLSGYEIRHFGLRGKRVGVTTKIAI